MTGVLIDWKHLWKYRSQRGVIQGDDGRRYHVVRGEIVGRAPRVGERFEFDVIEEPPKGARAVGVTRIEAPGP